MFEKELIVHCINLMINMKNYINAYIQWKWIPSSFLFNLSKLLRGIHLLSTHVETIFHFSPVILQYSRCNGKHLMWYDARVCLSPSGRYWVGKRACIFQQNGAPPNYSNCARAALDTRFLRRWINRAVPIFWPPWSTCLTPLDFFYWAITNVVKRSMTSIIYGKQ